MFKSIVVAGSARGIGLELVRQLSKDAHVLAIDRFESDDIAALARGPNVSFALADVTDPAALAAAATQVETVDCLMCVSGILGNPDPLLGRNASEDLLQCFVVNVQGTYNVVAAFLDKMVEGKIMLMSSGMGSLTAATHALNPAYSVSKAALNMLGRKLAVELKGKVDVVMMSPGVVRTAMNGGAGEISTEESVEGILRELYKSGTGEFLRYDGNGFAW